MIPKLKAGILTQIPHLKHKSKEDAEAFFQKIEKSSEYSLRQINSEWYIELSKKMNDADDNDNTVISGYDLKGLQDFSTEIVKVVEYIEPDFYKELQNWCNPRAYYFVGFWEDIEKCYSHFDKI